MLGNQEQIDTLMEKTYEYNFKNFDILSASSSINYLLRITKNETPVETPCQMNLRMAIQFYHNDSFSDVEKCYYELIEQKYVHASPTMFNAGTKKNQMSSCFLLTLGDNLESLLYSGAGDVGIISKLQGGIGLSMNSIRHSDISNSGKSSGVLPFGRIYDATIACVDQGGKRNGAMTITLNDWHIDFFDFIQTRDNYTHNGIRFKQANICAFISNLFMRRVKEEKDWTMFCPAKAFISNEKLLGKSGKEFDELYLELEQEAVRRKEKFNEIDGEVVSMEKKINSSDASEEFIMNYHFKRKERTKIRKNLIEFKTLNAREIYTKICDMNNKCSMPYIVYRDPVNYKNNMKNIGPCEGLNLCLEIIEPSTPESIASCNLGHLNLKKYVVKKFNVISTNFFAELRRCYDFASIGESTKSLVKNINKVIDYNYYPLDERDEEGNVIKQGKISKPNYENRPIGIGVSGLAEVFSLIGIEYGSEKSLILNKMIFACIYYNSLVSSLELSKNQGEYKNFRTGTHQAFIDGDWKTLTGSPLSQGHYQFDLWQQEADYLKSNGYLNDSIYDVEDNTVINPEDWGMEPTVDHWDILRENIIRFGVRNSMLVALMPTASSAQILRNAETTEAHQTLVYSRKLTHGNFTAFSEPFVRDMIKYNLWDKKIIEFIMMENGSIKNLHKFIKDFYPDKYNLYKIRYLQKIHKGMYEISQKVTMQMARQRGIYVCQSQSFNIYIAEPTINKMQSAHNYSNALQMKTGMYYLRQNPASQTSRFTVNMDIQEYHAEMKKSKNVVCTDEVCTMCE